MELDMGRQKTLWINEECWDKLTSMEGDSVSEKVRRCILAVDIATDAKEQALRKQIGRLTALLKSVGWKGDV